MLQNLPIVVSIPAAGTTPAQANALAVSALPNSGNTLEITGKATAGSGSLYLLRYFADLEEWRPWREYHKITVDSSVLGGFFSASYLIPPGNEYFLLLDPANAITATAKGQVRAY